MQQKIRILIVEDEEAIRTGLVDVFVYHGYEADYAADGTEGLEKALSGTFDMILLDVMLPGIDGFEICNRIRSKDREQPIIMLTAKTSEEDIIQGLSLGADDYVAKPFSVAQLVLRVQAVLRRSRVGTESDHHISLGDDIKIDCQNLSGNRISDSRNSGSRNAGSRNSDSRNAGNQSSGNQKKENISFTRREMDILQYLKANSDRPVSRDELLNKVWGYAKDLELETRTVDIHIAKLRRKIEPDPAEPRYLTTVRGAGYRLLME